MDIKTCQAKIIFFTVLILLLVHSKAFSVSEAGVLCLTFPPGARAAGMGEAYTAISNDALAPYFNPAGLISFRYVAGEIFYRKPYWAFWDDVYHFYFGGTVGLGGFGTIGSSFTYFSFGEQILTDVSGPEEKGRFSSYDWALSFCYARKLTQNMSIGGNLKIIQSNLAPTIGIGPEEIISKTSSWAIDLGFLYRGLLPQLTIHDRMDEFANLRKFVMNRIPTGLSFGLCIQNMGPKISYIDVAQADPLPQTLRIGLAYNVFDMDLLGVVLACDAEKLLVRRHKGGSSDSCPKSLFTSWVDQSFKDEIKQMTLHLGAEVTTYYVFTLRLGLIYNEVDRFRSWALGVGLGPETARFNFAYLPKSVDSKYEPDESESRFSLSVAF
ncbi:MAG: PorV/PorQ family protein [candidate division KSB1 bacterium]|nr:PorV/PorQ family protein [candidate division KSB1 bacterium]